MSRSRWATVRSTHVRCALVPLIGTILRELTCKALAPTATCLRATGTDDPDGTPKFRTLKRQHGKSNAVARSSGYHGHDAAVPALEGAVPGHTAVLPHGRFLRDVLRGRRARLPPSRHHAHHPRRLRGCADQDGGRALSRGRPV